MKTKPLCVLVDDEKSSLALLKSKIEETELLEIEKAFLDADKFLLHISKLKSEIIFLDIEMPIDGIEVAKKLKNKKIIFVSGHKEHAYKTFEVAPVDFVPKPISTFRLKQAIERALEHNSNSFITIKTQDAKMEEISFDEIVYIKTNEDDKRDKSIFLLGGNIVRAKDIDFTDLTEELPKNKFCRISSSCIANLSFVKKLLSADSVGVVFKNKIVELTLGENFKETFFEQKPNLRA